MSNFKTPNPNPIYSITPSSGLMQAKKLKLREGAWMITPSPHLPTLLFHWFSFHYGASDSTELEQWTEEG